MGSQHMEGGLLLIGPEGDFTPVELKTLLEAGAVPVRFVRVSWPVSRINACTPPTCF